MTKPTNLRLQIGDLLKRFGAQREVELAFNLDELSAGTASVAPDAVIQLTAQLERISEGVVVRGSVTSAWMAPCARCLCDAGGDIAVLISELYEADPVVGETYALEGEFLDLEPMIRDALVLELPTRPICRPECAGLCAQCGIDRNTETCSCETESNDPRWAALQSFNVQ